ncbi:unnamed protein product [Eruca vesicaria subsp. sativa]|uniref:NHR domain-containing protein n=1 Tax=Eruca vesicaria subsp. sativa TaxID=29727 RepID=A0ABC8LZH4_ERUVS|nr:unnamed protein product [Eruca vesicaria subsp. sativa]
MRHQVRLVVGDWERGAQGAWRFNVDKTMVRGDVELKENESFISLLGMVREKFNVDYLYGVNAHVLLTYHYPDLETEPEDYSAPPIEINEDEDVAVFMAVRVDNVWQEMYVTLGGQDVYNYRRQRNVEDGITAAEQPLPASGLVSIEGDVCDIGWTGCLQLPEAEEC